MMDPITGIGLTASVIQIVACGISTVKTIKEIYQQGSVRQFDAINDTSHHLTKVTRSLEDSLQHSNTPLSALSSDEQALLDLARKCQTCASKLQQELYKLQSQPKSSVFHAARASFRAIRKSGKIEDISKQLDTYQSTLETSLLYNLSRRFNAQSLRNEERFAKLDASLQHIIDCLARSQTSLSKLVTLESEHIKSHVTSQIQDIEQLRIENRLFDEVTKSLFYPDIFSRQEHIEHSFGGLTDTYEWIFEPALISQESTADALADGDESPPWDDFAEWLRSGQGLYWINGKAGSGKSTLVNYIYHSSHRAELLEIWSRGRLLLSPAYFFWSSGSMQQRSIDGCLRSLLYQILKQCPDLVTCLEVEPLPAWNENRLLTALQSIFEQSRVPAAICMFLDGLDEIEGDYHDIIKIINALGANNGNVKICFSSRPLLTFVKAFETSPGLQLQNLNKQSISSYVDYKLSAAIEKRIIQDQEDDWRICHIKESIVAQADGVFLWAVIATRDIREAVEGMADLDEIDQAVKTLPSELEDLFLVILNRINPVFQRDAARFLQIALFGPQWEAEWEHPFEFLSLYKLYNIHIQKGHTDARFVHETVAISHIVKACERLRTQIISHTAGLLELSPSSEGAIKFGLHPRGQPLLNLSVTFLHKTVPDFLRQNHYAQVFLSSKGYTEVEAHRCIARGMLATFTDLSEDVDPYDPEKAPETRAFYTTFGCALDHIRSTERLVGSAQSELMQSLTYDSLMQRYALMYEMSGGTDLSAGQIFHFGRAFIIDSPKTSIDVVGMAVYVGMELYVCERLGIAKIFPIFASDLPTQQMYRTNRLKLVSMKWRPPAQWRDRHKAPHKLSASQYHQGLLERLELEPDQGDIESAHTKILRNAFVASYMLACCKVDDYRMIQMLLRLGASPMIRVNQYDRDPEYFIGLSLWERWLGLLQNTRRTYIYHRRSKTMDFGERYPDAGFTPTVVFETTKALIASGADVEIILESQDSFPSCLNRWLCDFEIISDESAMLVLEECFCKEPEFRKFAAEIEHLFERPLRRPTKIKHRRYAKWVDLNPDECEILQPLLESWKRTWNSEDEELIIKALEDIWFPHLENWKRTWKSEDEQLIKKALEDIWRPHGHSLNWNSEDNDDHSNTSKEDEEDGASMEM